ncbi:hypothetical protein N9R43_01055 [bacterium]|nr:hypothetical protein [bacterium]
MNDLALTLGIDPGWIGVALGIALFLLGRHMGIQKGVVEGSSAMIDMLDDAGFLKVKSRRTDKDGNAVVEYSKVDE